MYKIYIEQNNANDDTATLLTLCQDSGSKVAANSIIAEFETSKSTYEISAPTAGYFYTKFIPGDGIPVGELFGVIFAEKYTGELADIYRTEKNAEKTDNDASATIRITKKAQMLARQHSIDLEDVPSINGSISEKEILNYLKQHNQMTDRSKINFTQTTNGEKIAVIGAGPSLEVILDVLTVSQQGHITAIFDDDPALQGTEIFGIPVIGEISPEQLQNAERKGIFDTAIIAINSSVKLRSHFYSLLINAGIKLTNIIHPQANIANSATLGTGNIILQFCNLSPCCSLGDNNYLSAYTSIEHHCSLGDSNSFGPGVMFSGMVSIGSNIKFGSGIFIEPGLTIGTNSVIASGITITHDIPQNTVAKSKNTIVMRPKD